uniref:Uncharacterized protein n=1 Tax=Lygus hesperus TaxID=30085 RepID=A0A0A9YQ20_LYGHE
MSRDFLQAFFSQQAIQVYFPSASVRCAHPAQEKDRAMHATQESNKSHCVAAICYSPLSLHWTSFAAFKRLVNAHVVCSVYPQSCPHQQSHQSIADNEDDWCDVQLPVVRRAEKVMNSGVVISDELRALFLDTPLPRQHSTVCKEEQERQKCLGSATYHCNDDSIRLS